MKKILVVAVLFIAVCAVQPAFSQFLIGGAVSYDKRDLGTPNSSASQFTVSPTLLYEINDRFDIGGTAGFSIYSKDTASGSPSEDYKVFSVGPVARYKFPALGIFTPFIAGDLTFGMIMYEADGADDETIFSVHAAIGGDLNLADHLRFYIQLPVAGFVYHSAGDYSETNFSVVTNKVITNISVGVFFSF
ncbi:MAG: porin family protein [Treponema sp.]|jgi:hypothetical protein|nr:porin family protein [Treponema sp.]